MSEEKSGMFSKFKSNKYVSGTSDFLQSNTMVAKVAFLLLLLYYLYIL